MEEYIRINKVLRELNISLERAVDYLNDEGIIIEPSPNTKISEEVYKILYDKFYNNSKPFYIKILEDQIGYILKLKPIGDILGWDSKLSYSIDKNNVVIGLNLCLNVIEDISLLSFFKNLKYLDISHNNIKDFSVLNELSSLEKLVMDSTKIKDLKSIENLKSLLYLSVAQNKIENFSAVSRLEKLEYLCLQSTELSSVEFLEPLKNIINLDLSFNKLANVSILKSLSKIEVLSLSLNKIEDYSFLKQLKNLKKLYIGACSISDLTFLKNLKIQALAIGENPIQDYSILKTLKNLNELRITNSYLSDVSFIKDLKSLIYLHLYDNKIENISFFKNLNKLKFLDIALNNISDINEFEFISKLPDLLIYANTNPCFEENNIVLERNQNHYLTIVNELSKLKEELLVYKLPAKVLLLGNTKSGKSTLLDFIVQEGNTKVLNEINESTHVLKIEKLTKRLKKDTLPTAVFYDFGGQDYYHGLYNAFMSKKSINIILWNQTTNYNQIQDTPDRNNEITRNFNVNYWLNQLRYFYTKENIHNSERIVDETLFLVQTHADLEHSRQYYFGNSDNYNLKNEFFVSLTQKSIESSKSIKAGLDYFIATLEENIEIKRQQVKKPKWYIDFINYILNKKGQKYTSLEEIKKYYKREKNEDLKFLSTDLEQLSYSGLILYYKYDSELIDVAWLDPSATLEHIYSKILKKDLIINNRGTIKYDDFKELVSDLKLIKMLSNQKVIFHDTFDDKIIIPGYLPLISADEKLYELMTFDFIEPSFVLKFEYFIPFGLINQLICLYGKNNSKKYYWRDQLLFTKDNKHKILIKLDFCNLEISVSIKSNENDTNLNLLKQELFSDILNLYWDEKPKVEINKDEIDEKIMIDDTDNDNNEITKKILNYIYSSNNYDKLRIENKDSPYKSPDDMYLSIDNKTFIHHKTLENLDKKTTRLISYECSVNNEIRSIDKTKIKEQSAGLYKLYTNNKNIQTMKKVFISYSNEDHLYKELLIKNLKPLTQFQLLKPWSCEDMTAGNWNEQIQNELKESDIVIFMMSLSFITSDYILREEVFKTFEELKINKSKKVICVLVKNFPWQHFEKFRKLTNLNDEDFTKLQDANTLVELTSNQFIPYYIDKKEGNKRYLLPLNKWEFVEDAYIEIIKNITENLD